MYDEVPQKDKMSEKDGTFQVKKTSCTGSEMADSMICVQEHWGLQMEAGDHV